MTTLKLKLNNCPLKELTISFNETPFLSTLSPKLLSSPV